MASEIDRLREEVRRRQRAANAKVSRLRGKGVELAGTKFDVRRDSKRVARYNRPQLEAYLSQLNTFVHRSTQYVALARGIPAPIKRIREVQGNYRAYNRTVGKMYGQVKNYMNPDAGMPIEDYDRTIRSKRIEAAGKASHRPYHERELVPHRVASLEALDKLDKDIKRRNAKTYGPDQLKKQRETATKMLNTIGNPQYIEKLNSLSDHQFDVIFNWMNFADDVSLRYLMVQSGLDLSDKESFAGQVEDQDAIQFWLNHASAEIPRTAPREGTFSKWEPRATRKRNTRRK